MTKRSIVVLLAMLVALVSAFPAAGMEVPRTTKDELKAKMDAGEDVMIVDVRRGSDWKGSEFKIKGAIRVEDLDAFAANQAKDAEIVLYCA
jgi:rhodanese-related sulfurtransferase